jgi:hypothetical protein
MTHKSKDYKRAVGMWLMKSLESLLPEVKAVELASWLGTTAANVRFWRAGDRAIPNDVAVSVLTILWITRTELRDEVLKEFQRHPRDASLLLGAIRNLMVSSLAIEDCSPMLLRLIQRQPFCKPLLESHVWGVKPAGTATTNALPEKDGFQEHLVSKDAALAAVQRIAKMISVKEGDDTLNEIINDYKKLADEIEKFSIEILGKYSAQLLDADWG